MRVNNQQWTDSLRSERYPFAGTGPLTGVDGLTIPNDFFLDLNLLVAQDTETVLLTSITTEANIPPVVRFELEDGTLVGLMDCADIQSNNQCPIFLGTAAVGVAVLDPNSLQIVQGWAADTHEFVSLAILPHLLIALDKRWRRGFELPDGTIIEGDAYLIADKGLWFERTVDGFCLHVTGDPFNGRVVPARGLKTINGVAPTDGSINLIGLSDTAMTGTTYIGGTTPFRLTVKPTGQAVKIELIG